MRCIAYHEWLNVLLVFIYDFIGLNAHECIHLLVLYQLQSVFTYGL